MHIRSVSRPLDHEAWWKKLAFIFYLWYLQVKISQFSQKTSTSQTHFGFINIGSETLTFRCRANRKSKFWFGSPCMYLYWHTFFAYFTLTLFAQSDILSDVKLDAARKRSFRVVNINWFTMQSPFWFFLLFIIKGKLGRRCNGHFRLVVLTSAFLSLIVRK